MSLPRFYPIFDSADWIARALMLAQRREMDDDPVVFALKDRVSLATAACAALVVAAAF